MNHQAVPKHSCVNFYNDFGGASRGFVTKNTYTVMPFSTSYAVDGKGRDRYIGIDNGGLGARYQPDL